jgi:hypothetical protein
VGKFIHDEKIVLQFFLRVNKLMLQIALAAFNSGIVYIP